MIKILDDFFEEKDFKTVQDFALNRAFYSPCFLEGTTEKNKENFYGNRWYFTYDPAIKKIFIKQVEKKFNIKINKIQHSSGIDQRNLDHFIPHTDVNISKLNALIMISGPTAVTNGTVFYTKGELDIHIGFRENRAVLFPSNWTHSPQKSEIVNLRRYTATLFIENYEE
jgi:hypothetical protein